MDHQLYSNNEVEITPRRGTILRSNTNQEVQAAIDAIEHSHDNDHHGGNKIHPDPNQRHELDSDQRHELEKVLIHQIHSKHKLERDNKMIIGALIFVVLVLVTQIMSTYYIFSRLQISFDSNGSLVSYGGKKLSVSNADMKPSAQGVLVDSKNNAVATSAFLRQQNISSLLSDYVVNQLKSVHIRQAFANATSNYQVLAVHRTHETGQYGSTLTIELPQGDVVVDGITYYATKGIIDSMNKVSKVSDGVSEIMWTKLPNVEITGDFNIPDESMFALETIQWNIKNEIPTYYNMSIVKYEECEMKEIWQSDYCKNASSHTVKHSDFPLQRFFSENILWTYSNQGFFEKITFNKTISQQEQFQFQSSKIGKIVSWVYDSASNKTSECSATNDLVPENILNTLKNEIPTYMGNSYKVNGKKALKFLLKLFSHSRDSYQVVEWFESKLNGDLLRLQISSYDNTLANARRSFVFYDIIKIDEISSLTNTAWWPKYAQSVATPLACQDISQRTQNDFSIVKFGFRQPLSVVETDLGLSTVNNAGNGTQRRLNGILDDDLDYEHNEHLKLYDHWVLNEKDSYHRRLDDFKNEYGHDHYFYASEQQRRELVGCYRFSSSSVSSAYSIKKYLPIPRFSASYYCDGKNFQLTLPSFSSTSLTLPGLPAFIVSGGGFLNLVPTSAGLKLTFSVKALPWYLQSSCYAVTWSNNCYAGFNLGSVSLSAGQNCQFYAGSYGWVTSDCGLMKISTSISSYLFSVFPSITITFLSNSLIGVTASIKLVALGIPYTQTLIDSWFPVDG